MSFFVKTRLLSMVLSPSRSEDNQDWEDKRSTIHIRTKSGHRQDKVDWEKGRTKEIRAKADLGRLGQRRGQGQANYDNKKKKDGPGELLQGRAKEGPAS